MCLIDVPNLKEIDPWEDYFMWFKILQKRCEEEKCEENWAIFGLFTTNPISFKFDM